MKVIIVGNTGIKDAVISAPFTDLETPVLYVKKDEIPALVWAEILRLAPDTILVFGGTLRVSDAVVAELGTVAPVTRIAGPSVYSTAVAASQVLNPVVVEPPIDPPIEPPVEPPTEPPASGYPDASTTGPYDESLIPATPVSALGSSYDGQVLENFHAREVYLEYRGVTLRNFKITRTDRDLWFAAMFKYDGVATHGKILTVDGAGNPVASGGKGIAGRELEVRFMDIGFMEDGVTASRMLVEDSYIHDLLSYGGSHMDGVASHDGSGSIIRRCTILMEGQTGAVNFTTDFGAIDDILVEDCLLGGGTYTVYSRNGGYGNPTNVVIRNNELVGDWVYGPESHDGSIVWENNRHAGTGELILL